MNTDFSQADERTHAEASCEWSEIRKYREFSHCAANEVRITKSVHRT